ncbi:hypothetical protein [Aestuariivivens sediminicola]|uniref:hypothetical protein n=1 Tax=Aestuariivivens sediminicola TaxID=2913560 RepID=UPI001F58D739|nr:hypothetical protein [Aestuariivivens sediminicola]
MISKVCFHFKTLFLTLIVLILIIPYPLLSQEEEFRVITRKELDTIYGKHHFDGKRKVFVTHANGQTKSIKTNNILSIRKDIEGWKYFEWEPTELTDFLEISIDSMSGEELFLKAKEWIEMSFLPTEYGFLIQPDSMFAEKEGRGLYKNNSAPKGFISVRDNLPKIIPELEYRFNIDEDNYKITLVGCNQIILKSIVPLSATFYTINLTFHETGYKIDPINLFYCYIDPYIDYEEKPLIELNPFKAAVDGFVDGILGNYDKTYILEFPIYDITPFRDESGMIERKWRCFFTRVEILFNDLNRTLYNYINGNKIDPNIYVYYPETNCWQYWRTW